MPEAMNTVHFDRILVVDDATANLQFLTTVLTEHGYTVYPASDGELALEFVRSILPDLILLDIRMPGLDGYEVCRRLKAAERTHSVPIIFISILEDECDKVKGLQAGAVDYITKPFQTEEVLARVRIHLRLRELTERLEQTVAERTAELHAANAQLQIELVERQRAEEALRRSNRKLSALSSCNQALLRAVDEQTLLNDICRIVCDEAAYQMAWVGYAERDEAKTVRPVAWAGGESGYLAVANITWADTEYGREPAGTAIRSGKSVYVQDVATPPQFAPWRENALQRGYHSTLALPMKDESAHVFGVMLIYSAESNAFTPDEIRLLEELAGDLAFGIIALRTRAERKRAEEALRVLNEELELRVSQRTAELEAINKELQEFAYIVSHDLKTPLRGIRQLTQWLQTDYANELDAEGKEQIELLGGQVKHMTALIDGILHYSRVLLGSESEELVDLKVLLSQIIHTLMPPPHIAIQIDEALPIIQGDRIKITQVFQNLVGNAVKFLDKPTGIITVACEDIGDRWLFHVEDNGPGIEPRDYERIFKIFQSCAPRKDQDSTGIGLTVVKKMIELYGGRIWVESEIGQWSRFSFTLPKRSGFATSESMASTDRAC